jgi:dihydrofolate synthase/folylpolyglutamate synthase
LLMSDTVGQKFERDAAESWLLSRVNYERALAMPHDEQQLKLARMRELLERLGRPDAGLKIVHVAGTKGKGSTSAMIAAMLTAAGHRVGVFSSPHLERLEERFAVDGTQCSAEELAALVEQVRPAVAAMDAEAAKAGDPQDGPTYFEITTAIALLHFAARQVDAAVLEVGLGGRLDSTNVCEPMVSVITSIGFDHMAQLGNTLTAIAGEKAGIIKPGVPVVSGVLEDEPREVIEHTAAERGCRLIQVERDFSWQRDADCGMDESAIGEFSFRCTLAGQALELLHVTVAMKGAHQAANAAVALATIAELRRQGWNVSLDAMRHGLSVAKLPGRVEVLAGDPVVVLDTAHNEPSAKALAAALAEIRVTGDRTLILAASRDKDVPGIIRELAPAFDRVVVTQYQKNPRAVPTGELSELVRAGMGGKADVVEAYSTPSEAWQAVSRTAGPSDLICIAGSFFLAGELRQRVIDSRGGSQDSS